MTQTIQLLDVVALLESLPDRGMIAGQVGTVVEIHEAGVFEVEFSDNSGRTYASLALPEGKIIALHYDPIAA
ncbi:MAG: DUF4926 domain-containing protein [Verrucomicrobiota bacterium]